MRNFSEWCKLEECIGSASVALKKAGISFKREDGKLAVAEEDMAAARKAIKSGSDTPEDTKFLGKA